ncbi:MAG: DsbA family oxidoreductase [Sphingomonadales bacterium]
MRIDIISDSICPWCWIGKRRLGMALEQWEAPVEVHWHPFELNPDLPDQGMERKAYMEAKFGDTDGAARAYAPVWDAAGAVGLDIDFDAIPRVPNTLKSHCLIGWADPGVVQDRVVEGLFSAYFIEGRDIGSVDVLVSVAEAAGMDGAAVAAKLAAGDDFNLIRTRARSVRDKGVAGVPCFVVDGAHVVSGAQEPRTFLDLFAKVRQATASEG